MLGGNTGITFFSVASEETWSALLSWFKCDFVALCKLGIHGFGREMYS